MSAALRSELVPVLTQMGFAGRFPHFHRSAAGAVQFLSVLFDKPATAFVLEFGAHPLPEGDALDPRIGLAHVSMFARARLQTESRRWFAFGRYGADPEGYRTLAASVAALLPQVDFWFANGERGSNIHTLVP